MIILLTLAAPKGTAVSTASLMITVMLHTVNMVDRYSRTLIKVIQRSCANFNYPQFPLCIHQYVQTI